MLLQARSNGMLVIRDELAGLFLQSLAVLRVAPRDEFWLEAWNGKPYAVERMTRPPVEVEHLLVGVTGGFQPTSSLAWFDGDADGLYARVSSRGQPKRPIGRSLTQSKKSNQSLRTSSAF